LGPFASDRSGSGISVLFQPVRRGFRPEPSGTRRRRSMVGRGFLSNDRHSELILKIGNTRRAVFVHSPARDLAGIPGGSRNTELRSRTTRPTWGSGRNGPGAVGIKRAGIAVIVVLLAGIAGPTAADQTRVVADLAVDTALAEGRARAAAVQAGTVEPIIAGLDHTAVIGECT
jgi:hypothetical protein